jgi:hypothetical protein
MTDTARKTALQEQIEARRPHQKKIALQGFPGLEKNEIVLRLLRKGEANAALAFSHGWLDRLCEKNPTLRENKKFVEDLTTISFLYSASRDASDPDGLPAFLSPDWMEKNFESPEFDYLLRVYNAFVGEVHRGGSQHLGPGKLLDLLEWIAARADQDAINDELLLFQHDMLAEALIRAAVLWKDATNEALEIRQRLNALAAAGFVPADDENAMSAIAETLSIHGTRLLAEDHANDVLANAAPRIRTARDAELAMSMLGWKEGSPSWRRVLGEESGDRTS